MKKISIALYVPLPEDHKRAVELGFSEFANAEEHEEHIKNLACALDREGYHSHISHAPPDVLAGILKEHGLENTSEERAAAIAIASGAE